MCVDQYKTTNARKQSSLNHKSDVCGTKMNTMTYIFSLESKYDAMFMFTFKDLIIGDTNLLCKCVKSLIKLLLEFKCTWLSHVCSCHHDNHARKIYFFKAIFLIHLKIVQQ